MIFVEVTGLPDEVIELGGERCRVLPGTGTNLEHGASLPKFISQDFEYRLAVAPGVLSNWLSRHAEPVGAMMD
jgi:hypothetical protein